VPVASIAQLIAFNREHSDQVMPWFGQQWLEQAAASGDRADPEYIEAREAAQRLAGPEGIDAALAEHSLDALIAPSTGPAWRVDWVNGDAGSGGSSGLAAIAGYHKITVPMGQVHGLPVGLSFFAAKYSEARLISLAYAFEQASKLRQPPGYRAGSRAGAD
jgi:amidase